MGGFFYKPSVPLFNEDLLYGSNFGRIHLAEQYVPSVMGKHPDLMVAHPTSTIFPTIGRNFEIS